MNKDDYLWITIIVGSIFILALVASEFMAQRDILRITEIAINKQ